MSCSRGACGASTPSVYRAMSRASQVASEEVARGAPTPSSCQVFAVTGSRVALWRSILTPARIALAIGEVATDRVS